MILWKSRVYISVYIFVLIKKMGVCVWGGGSEINTRCLPLSLSILYFNVCMYIFPVYVQTCGGQKTTHRSLLCPSILWVPATDLGSSGCVATNSFIFWVILLNLHLSVLFFVFESPTKLVFTDWARLAGKQVQRILHQLSVRVTGVGLGLAFYLGL